MSYISRNRFGKVGVLAGGPSSEREISLRSGMAVFNALTSRGLDVHFIDIKEDPKKILRGIDIEIAFIALHGGFGEDGTVQNILEEMDITYTGSRPRASKLALDKIASRKIFIKNGIPIPAYIVVDRRKDPSQIWKRLKLPLIIKPQKEGSSIGLSVIKRDSQVASALNLAFRYSKAVLVEKFIKGRELTVGILDKEALPVIEIVPGGEVYDYGAKYIDKETGYIVPAKIGHRAYKKAQTLGIKAHSVLGCKDFSRVDMRMDSDGNIFVLEVNTIPGLTERSLLPKAAEAKGISFDRLCVKLLELALDKKEVL